MRRFDVEMAGADQRQTGTVERPVAGADM